MKFRVVVAKVTRVVEAPDFETVAKWADEEVQQEGIQHIKHKGTLHGLTLEDGAQVYWYSARIIPSTSDLYNSPATVLLKGA